MELRNLFENNYASYSVILTELVSPIFGEKVKETNKDITPERQDEKIINRIKIFATLGGAFPITFVDVEIKNSVKLEHNKVSVQRCVRRILDEFSSALIFFHYEDTKNTTWRITFVNKGEKNTDSTNPKRYTYLCGKNHSCRTANDRFEILQKEITSGKKQLDQLMTDAFSVENVSKEFFDEYKVFYEDLVQYITGNRYIKNGNKYIKERIHKENTSVFKKFLEAANNDVELAQKLVRDYIKKTMGRIVFLQFLQKKKWLGVELDDNNWTTGDPNFIANLFKNSSEKEKNDFLEQVLEPLFFGMLNTTKEDRREKFEQEHWNTELLNKFKKIPYLNGGLFKCEDLDQIKIKFPKELFCNPQKENIARVFQGKNENYGYTESCGLFDFFKRYNFTIDESDPNDMEVGVDPEMLGKIFENLLEDNKDKGAFYTPKEIVNYMCRESLLQYLITKTKDLNEEDLRTFVTSKKLSEKWAEENKTQILKVLENIKICDPAVGSGAFPMGLLNLLFELRHALTPTDKMSRAEIKMHIVQHSIYGVDIEKGAVDIARLRFWLSIVVDAEKPEPLPNLDYKIMQGNSLIESYKNTDLSNLLTTKTSSLFDADAEQIQALQNAIQGYYLPKDFDAKEKIESTIKEKILSILSERLPNPNVLEELSTMDLKSNTEFFLWHTWFSDVFNRASDDCTSGFDIVIGNPPYLEARSESFNETLKDSLEFELSKYHKKPALFFPRGADLLIFFFELSLRLINKNGINAFITQNSWLSSDYGKKFQNYIQSNTKILGIIDSDYQYFDNANINTIMTFFQGKEKGCNITYAICHNDISVDYFKLNYTKYELSNIDISTFKINNKFLVDYKWGLLFFTDKRFLSLLRKASAMGEKLDENVNGFSIGQGVNTTKKNISIKKKDGYFPIFVTEDGAIYNWDKPTMYVSSQAISKDRKLPVLIMPRGVGSRYFCAYNNAKGYSASYIDIYASARANTENIIRLWLFCNSSFCCLLREYSGRKNLGGGMLKAEATDLKQFPLLFDFKITEDVYTLFDEAKKTEIYTDIKKTLNDPIHQKIDDYVFSYFNFSDSEKKYIYERLIFEVENRNKKSKT